MPMDIRNFFAKQGAAPAKKTKSSDKDKKSRKKTKPKASQSISSNASRKTSSLSPIQEDASSAAAKKSKRKYVLDSDTEDEKDQAVVANKTEDSSGSDTEGDEPKKAPARASNEKKSNKDLKEVSTSDYFASPTSSKRSSSRKSKPSRSYVLDSDSEDEQQKDSDDYVMENDQDEDEELEVQETKMTRKRASPKVAKSPPSKPVRKASPFKKQKLGENEEDAVDLANDCSGNDDDMPEKETPSRAKNKAPPKKAAEDTPPSTKKRKTQTSTSKKPPAAAKKEKEPLIEPTLELDSFDVDAAVPECMTGTTFVFTGVLDGISRDDTEDFVKILGGRVTGAVSSKTSYLVCGPILEDGRPYTEGSKYKKATSLGSVKIVMGVKPLYGLAKLYSDRAEARQPKDKENNQNEASVGGKGPAAKPATSSKPVVNNPYAKKPVNNPYAKKKATVANPYAKSNAKNPYAKASSQTASSQNEEAPVSNRKFSANDLWVDKHAPETTRSILGNKDSVTKLTNWLDRWEGKFNNDKAVGKAFSNPQGPWKAALLSGPPGIGKTTTATLVAKEAGRDVLEFNASDVRSKKAMSESFGDIIGSQSVEGFFTKPGSAAKAKKPGQQKKLRCLIFDEVDGMSSGDRGGMAELIQMIKKSRVPIICICNDRQSQKMKSLLPYCLDLRFRRPPKGQIAKAAMKVAEIEGLLVEQNAAEAISESCGNDIRQVINCMQMWASEKQSKSMTYKGLKEREHAINKDEMLRVSLFDASKLILEGRKGLSDKGADAQTASFYKRNDAFFVDYSFTGLIVQQNYLKLMNPRYLELKRANDDDKALAFLDSVHSAAASMSDYAMVENKIRGGDMNWGLLPFSGTLVVKTGFHASGPNGSFFPGFPEFTTWLGRNSSKGKKQRILQELNHHMNYKISGGTQEVRLSYLPFLRQRFYSQLKDSQENGRIIELMDDYGLDRDDVFENLDEFKLGKGGKLGDLLDSKAKSAFTREYNKGSHKSQALVDEQGAPTKKKRKEASASADPDDPEVEEEEEEEDEDLEKLRNAFAKKGRKAAAAKAKKSAGKGRGKQK